MQFQQQSDEWLEWRKQGIGSSDAPIIMGVSPYMTPLELWKIKMGLWEGPEKNPAMLRGTNQEPILRGRAEEMLGYKFEPALFECVEYPFLRASLDGWNEESKKILEIKYIGKTEYEETRIKRVVPEKYFAQVQHQLMVTGAKDAFYLFACEGEKPDWLVVLADESYFETLLHAELKFYDYMRTKTAPPLSERDYMEVEGELWDARFTQLKEAQRGMKLAEANLEFSKKCIASAMAHSRVSHKGVKVTKVKTQGRIDYSKIPGVQSLSTDELEKFRGADIESVRFTFPKGF